MKLQKYLLNQRSKLTAIQDQIARFENVQSQFPKLKLEIKESKIDLYSQNILFECKSHELQKYICSSNSELMTNFLVGYAYQKQITDFNIFPYFSFQNERIFLTSNFRYYYYQMQFRHPNEYNTFVDNTKFDQKLKEINLPSNLELNILSFCHSTPGKNNVPLSEFLARY